MVEQAVEHPVEVIGVDQAIVARVANCLRSVYEDSFGKPLAVDDAELVGLSLREIGIDSADTLAFLVAVEDEFGIEWSDSAPVEVLSSVLTISQFVQDECATQ
jgi:acyl carrier protein